MKKFRRNPRISVRKLAIEAHASGSTVQRALDEDLMLKPSNITKRKLLSDGTKKFERLKATSEFSQVL